MSNEQKLLEPIDCELVIGFVGAVGTKFRDVIQRLEAQFKLAGYPKSRAMAHHTDAICEDDSKEMVQFMPFTGVGPRRYYDLFSIEGSGSFPVKRKDRDSGKALTWQLQESRLRIQMRAFTYLESETQAARLFQQWIPNGEGKSNDG